MLKSLLMASALTMAFSGTAMADDAPSVGSSGCSSCAVPTSNAGAPVKMAQAAMQAGGREVAAYGDGEQGPLRSCCDPKLSTMSWGTFADHLDPTNPSFTNRYGLFYQPTTAFHTAMHNTTNIVHVLVGSPSWSVVIMEGDMRTDGVPAHNPALSSTPGPNDAANAWSNSSGYLGHLATRVNPTNLAHSMMAGWLNGTTYPSGQYPFGAANSNVFDLAHTSGWSGPGGPHMKADGSVYAVKTSFWVYYQFPGRPMQKRRVFCNGIKDKFAGWQKTGTAVFKMAAGSAPTLGMSERAPDESEQAMRVGAAQSVSAEDAKRIEELRKAKS